MANGSKQTEALTQANALKFPLHLTSTALQLLQLAVLRGLSDEPDLAVSKIWDGAGDEGILFPRKA